MFQGCLHYCIQQRRYHVSLIVVVRSELLRLYFLIVLLEMTILGRQILQLQNVQTNAQPYPSPDTSVCKMKGLLKSRKARIGGVTRCCRS